MDKAIKHNEEDLTLRQLLTSLRTHKCWKVPIFTEVRYWKRKEEYIGICHRNECAEAQLIVENLPTLCIARLGEKAREWFTCSKLETLDQITFDHTSKKIINNSECEYGFLDRGVSRYSEAELEALRIQGLEALEEVLETARDELSSIDDSINEDKRARNVEEEFEREYIFELNYIFNLTPPIREGPHRSGDTLATLATNASQATKMLQE